MADKKISDFSTLPTAQDSDLILVSSSNETYNMQVGTLKQAAGEAAIAAVEAIADEVVTDATAVARSAASAASGSATQAASSAEDASDSAAAAAASATQVASKYVRFDDEQSLTTAEQAQARGNIGSLAADLGSENEGKVLVVGTDGNITTSNVGIPVAVKTSLLNLVQHVAYIDGQGQQYYNALYAALHADEITLTSIEAIIDQGYEPVCTTDTLDYIRQYLSVLAQYSDGTEEEVNDYTLSGTLTAGTATISVQFMNKTDTVSVDVTQLPSGYTHRECVVANGTQAIWSGLYETDMQGISIVHKELKTDTTEKTGHILSSLNYFLPYIRDFPSSTTGINRGTSFNRFGNQEATIISSEKLGFNVPYTIESYIEEDKIRVVGANREVLLTSGQTASSTRQLSFFAYSSNGTTFNSTFSFYGKFYFMKLFRGSTLVHNYIPCTNSSNVAGLYDAVAGTFLTPAAGTLAWE